MLTVALHGLWTLSLIIKYLGSQVESVSLLYNSLNSNAMSFSSSLHCDFAASSLFHPYGLSNWFVLLQNAVICVDSKNNRQEVFEMSDPAHSLFVYPEKEQLVGHQHYTLEVSST